jgi:pyruvate dehydrogenase E2 component (dihydrolipoamide acetyltransferase)
MPNEIKLPRLKENVDSYEVTEVLVAPGQAVAKDQPILVVNADKSNLEVYAPMPGKLVKLNVKVGDEIKIGSVYCVIEGGNGAAPQPAKSAEKPAKTTAPSKSSQGTQQRKDDHTEEPSPKDVRTIKASVAAPAPRRAAIDGALGTVIPASPATRWLARKLDVDLRTVTATGPGGRITEDDVRNTYAGGGLAAAPGAAPAKPLPNFEQFGAVQREPLTKTRRLTAQQMHLAWSTIPHVTQHDAADVTDLEAFRKSREGKGVKLTVTAFALKAVAIALRQFPTFNSSLDLAGGQLILKKYVHVGVAVDTKGGLLVPVIRDVDKKGVEELAAELTDTAEKARAGKADMSGGCFTITNLGGIGGTAFTPIVNWPEVAILGMSRGRLEPVWRDGAFVPRLMLPLSLSYDHRVIDGADAARFTRRVAEMLENPWLMVLHS